MTLKVLAFAASLRKASWNRKLIGLASRFAQEAGAEVDQAEFSEFDMPLYNADLQSEGGFPAGALELARRIQTVDGLLIASPEYNYSLPGTLKNALDWISRMRPMPLAGKSALLLSTSNGFAGGIRGLWQLRIPLEGLNVFVNPAMFSLPFAEKSFDAAGKDLVDPAVRERLQKLIAGYLKAAVALAGR